MVSKEEAEKKLLKIFYDVKLNLWFKKNPTHASIDEFEKTEDPDDLDDWYGIKDNKLTIGMWANNYEHGIPFFAVIMAHDSAKHWREDPLTKWMKLYILSHLLIPFITMILGYLIRSHSIIGGIAINLIGTGILIYFIILKINWRKRVKTRFNELFRKTGINLPTEKIEDHSKTRFSDDIIILNILQGFTIFLLIISWFLIFSEGV